MVTICIAHGPNDTLAVNLSPELTRRGFEEAPFIRANVCIALVSKYGHPPQASFAKDMGKPLICIEETDCEYIKGGIKGEFVERLTQSIAKLHLQHKKHRMTRFPRVKNGLEASASTRTLWRKVRGRVRHVAKEIGTLGTPAQRVLPNQPCGEELSERDSPRCVHALDDIIPRRKAPVLKAVPTVRERILKVASALGYAVDTSAPYEDSLQEMMGMLWERNEDDILAQLTFLEHIWAS